MSLYRNNGPAGTTAWDRWRTGINRKIEQPPRIKTCKKGYPNPYWIVLPVFDSREVSEVTFVSQRRSSRRIRRRSDKTTGEQS